MEPKATACPAYWIVTWPGKDQGVHPAYQELKEAEHAAKNIANYSTRKTETTIVPLYASSERIDAEMEELIVTALNLADARLSELGDTTISFARVAIYAALTKFGAED